MSSEKKIKKNWNKEETKALLIFYSARKEEFEHSRRKKFAFQNVLEDMLSAGVTESYTTAAHLESKIGGLLRAYKSAIDNAKRTGAAPFVAPFMDDMEEIFGSKPIISNQHTRNVGAAEIDSETHAVEVIQQPTEAEFEEEWLDSDDFAIPEPAATPEVTNTSSSSSTSAMRTSRKRMTRATYFERRLRIRQLHSEQKELNFQQFRKDQENQHKEKMDFLKEIFKNNE